MENEPFEDVFPIEHGAFPASYVGLPQGIGSIHINFFRGFGRCKVVSMQVNPGWIFVCLGQWVHVALLKTCLKIF